MTHIAPILLTNGGDAAAAVLSRIKRVMASVKLFLILHPPRAAENVKNLSLPQI